MEWLRKIIRPDGSVPIAKSESAAQTVDWVVLRAHTLVRAGYLSRADIVADVQACANDEGIDPDVFDAEGLVDREIRDLKAEQMRWPAMTDWDRLDAAMEGLEMRGIVARQDFSCCGTCGQSDIWAEVDAFEKRGARAKGYVFFHQQDTESAVEGTGLYFNYGNADPHHSEKKSVLVGRELVGALEAAGLKPKWDGDLGTRVYVPLDWKRRWERA